MRRLNATEPLHKQGVEGGLLMISTNAFYCSCKLSWSMRANSRFKSSSSTLFRQFNTIFEKMKDFGIRCRSPAFPQGTHVEPLFCFQNQDRSLIRLVCQNHVLNCDWYYFPSHSQKNQSGQNFQDHRDVKEHFFDTLVIMKEGMSDSCPELPLARRPWWLISEYCYFEFLFFFATFFYLISYRTFLSSPEANNANLYKSVSSPCRTGQNTFILQKNPNQ